MTDREVRTMRSRAILVGVARYDDPALPNLPSADRAAADLTQGFAERLVGDALQVDTIVNADRREFVRALVEAAADAEDQLIFYFAGHGVLSRFGDLVLATRDCDSRAPELTGLPWNSVRSMLADTQARSVVVILDCCFSGAADFALQESRHTAAVPTGSGERQFTYLVAGRTPWPYQPGTLSGALRTAIKTLPEEEGASPDFAALVKPLQHEMVEVSQPKLAISDSRPTANKHRVSPLFISCRLKDNNLAAALDHAITTRLGEDAIFRSSRSIPLGTDYQSLLMDSIRRARVVVAIIGPGWESRSNTPNDWVASEIATAFEHGIPVVPVIVGTRWKVRPEELPERIRELAYLQFLQITADTPEAIDAVVERLLGVL